MKIEYPSLVVFLLLISTACTSQLPLQTSDFAYADASKSAFFHGAPIDIKNATGIEFGLAPSASSQYTATSLDEAAMMSLETYDSELASVAAAVERFNPHSVSSDREYIGVVIRQFDVYRYLVARGKPGEDTVTVHLPVPQDAEVVAYWHTHGSAGAHRHLFSAADTSLVRLSGKPFYMADASGDIRIYRPGDPTLSIGAKRRLGLGFQGNIAAGELLCRQTNRLNRLTVQSCNHAHSG